MKWQIFVLGTNNWQGGGEFAPGSGILHHGHHEALNKLPNVQNRCYSLWPSGKQTSPTDRDDFRVHELSHQIPICESVSPVSNKRWHSMDEAEFSAYRAKLLASVEDYITYAEDKHKTPFNLFMAHHCFVNPTVMVEVNDRRVAAGKTKVPIVTFAHGTALKMYENELKGLEEYPTRFYPWIREEMKIFENSDKISGVFAIADAQKAIFRKLFPEYPEDCVAVTPNGYNQSIFKEVTGATISNTLGADAQKPLAQLFYEGFELKSLDADVVKALTGGAATAGTVPNPAKYKKVVLFTGKFADWKRLDLMLRATALNDSKDESGEVCTLIVGSGDNSARKIYVDQAYKDLKLKNTFFLGPQPQDILSRLNTIANVGVFPSQDEPFGLVFIECFGCGTPAIGAKSGGPVEFVTDEVGALIPEGDSITEMTPTLAATIRQALGPENWKKTKGPVAKEYAIKKFSLSAQCANMLTFIDKKLISINRKKKQEAAAAAAALLPKNLIRVRSRANNNSDEDVVATTVASVRKLLAPEGEFDTVTISGLGVAISNAVAVVEELKNGTAEVGGPATVVSIETKRGVEGAKAKSDNILITVTKKKQGDQKSKI